MMINKIGALLLGVISLYHSFFISKTGGIYTKYGDMFISFGEYKTIASIGALGFGVYCIYLSNCWQWWSKSDHG